MKTKNLNIKLSVIMICINAFFYGIYGNGYYWLAISFAPICSDLFNFKRDNSQNSTVWFIFICSAVMSSFFSRYIESSITFIIMILEIFCISRVLGADVRWHDLFAKTVFFIVSINVVATYLSLIVPDTMLTIAKKLYSGESLTIYTNLLRNKAYAGINSQTGANAWCISIFIGFAASAVFNNKRKNLNYILIVLGIIALFLTKKRSFLLSNACAAIILFWNTLIADKHKLRKIVSMLIIGVIIYLIIKYHPSTQGILDKMEILEEANDISNGRTDKWRETIKIWKTNPILGVGTNTLGTWYMLSSHNVYLQVLAEMGILGVVSFIMLLLSNFKRSMRIYRNVVTSNILLKKDKILCGVAIYVEVIFIVYSFFGNPLYAMTCLLTYTMFVAVMDSYYKLMKGRKNEDRDINISKYS